MFCACVANETDLEETFADFRKSGQHFGYSFFMLNIQHASIRWLTWTLHICYSWNNVLYFKTVYIGLVTFEIDLGIW